MSAESSGGDSRYTHDEMRSIFERAGISEALHDDSRRYSLAEVEAIGAEAGLDPAHIRRAAVSVHDVSIARRILGAPTRFFASHFSETPVDEERLADIVESLRRETTLHGELRFVPDGVEWRARPALGTIIVHFTPRRKGTRITVLVAREDAALLSVLVGCGTGFAIGMMTGIAAVAASHGSALLGLTAFAAGTVAGAYASMRFLWSRAARRATSVTGSLLDTIVSGAEWSSENAPGK